ncbi:MAG TPA: endonuclease [Patescibacteria group bacterium]|nr:endonuclease [Patescibacteria group bacterium]
MEGPSLFLAQEQLIIFKGKKIKIVNGNTKVGKERFVNKNILDIFSWGKHLVFQFDEFALRIHFLLYGTFEADMNGISITGDYKKSQTPRLQFIFDNGDITMFNCSVKIHETNNLKSEYDYSINIMSKDFDREKAFNSIKDNLESEIADILLTQTIFAGVGNIIKNEVLFLARTNPKEKVINISDAKIKEIINLAVPFSEQFYEWRKKFILKKHYKIYRKSVCTNCGGKVTWQTTGKFKRRSFYCPICQPLFSPNP